MRLKVPLAILVVLLLLFAVAGCDGLSCTASPPSTTTPAPTTTLAPSTTTTLAPTTSTTLSALEAYRVAMRAWADQYGPGLSQAYQVMSGANFANPTPQQVQAAVDLDALMGRMVSDLRAIQAPPDLSPAHAEFVASLDRMAAGVHELAQALQEGRNLAALGAVATVAAAWQQGTQARTTLEQALGFSLSG